ncbi:MAG: MBL fold metallo-hydrolase [Thermoplasmata archaeon]|nr:MBL fold metallo-hydrolase [Thermoplasmata archaeon]
MRITWYGHACFKVQGEHSIVTDPHDGKSIGLPAPSIDADVVLMSHDHFDHNCRTAIRNSNCKLINKPGKYNEKGFEITGIETFHDEASGSKRGKNIVFKFKANDINFCHLGDLGHALNSEHARKLGEVDVLFIPVGETYTLPISECWETVNVLQPKIVIPMHYKIGTLTLPINPVDVFLRNAGSEEVVHLGSREKEINKEDLSGGRKIWVFSF